jgi:hypothetical protein
LFEDGQATGGSAEKLAGAGGRIKGGLVGRVGVGADHHHRFLAGTGRPPQLVGKLLYGAEGNRSPVHHILALGIHQHRYFIHALRLLLGLGGARQVDLQLGVA